MNSKEQKDTETPQKYRNAPTVILVGRPNVGKSTLFNRLLRQRRAITDPTPGVTRDPVAKDAFLAGKPVRLVDTGGFKLDNDRDSAEGLLDEAVVEKTLATIKNADAIVLLLEAGVLTAEDEEFIALLRPYKQKLIVAVNKTEGGRREHEAFNLLSFGFDQLFFISAEHGDNVSDLSEAVAEKLDEEGAFSRLALCETDGGDPIRIAVLGKPNTGKSTLSNRLTASESSLVSDVPGTTRDVVEGAFTYKNRDFLLLDTAGIRRKSKVTENVEYYSVNRAIKAIDDADIVFLMIDAQEGLSEQDKKIAGLAAEKGRGVIFALNKWDEMPAVKNTFEAVRDRLRFMFGKMEYAPVVAVSAKTGFGADKLLDAAIRLYGQLCRKTDTGPLNQALERWMTENPPPQGPQTRFKIKYAVQTSSRPVKFVFFASRSRSVSDSYISYLRNKMRKDLGLAEIPIEIEIRSSAKEGRK